MIKEKTIDLNKVFGDEYKNGITKELVEGLMIKNYPRGYEYPTEIPTKIWNEYNLDFQDRLFTEIESWVEWCSYQYWGNLLDDTPIVKKEVK